MTYEEHRKRRDQETTDYLQLLLLSHKGNVSSAARESGINNANFYRLLRRFGVEPGNYRSVTVNHKPSPIREDK